MNRSKLYEWLLDNDCPWEWRVDEFFATKGSVQIVFYDKEASDD